MITSCRSATFSLIAAHFAAVTILFAAADGADARSSGGGKSAGSTVSKTTGTGTPAKPVSASNKPKRDKEGNIIKPPCKGIVVYASNCTHVRR